MRVLTWLCLLCSSPVFAGVYVEMKVTNLQNPQDKSSLQKTWIQDGRLRSETGGSVYSVLKDQSVYVVDTANRNYRVIDQAMLSQMADRMAAMRKQMDAHMASLPPEQRAMMEKFMNGHTGAPGGAGAGAAAAPAATVKDTGRSDSVDGRSCRIWEISRGGRKDAELCVVPASSLPGGDEWQKVMRSMSEFMDKLQSTMHSASAAFSGLPSQMLQINGVPVLTRRFNNQGAATLETRLTAIRAEPVAAAQFEMPAGYREEKLPVGPGHDSPHAGGDH